MIGHTILFHKLVTTVRAMKEMLVKHISKLSRGVNNLWTNGGLQYGPPVR